MSAGRLSWCAAEVRRNDYDRYLTVLFSPPAGREDLFALYAFNAEIAKTRDVVSEPMLGHIRLQWWRDALDELYAGSVRQHPVLQRLRVAVEQGKLPRAAFDTLIDTRETDLDDKPPADLATLEDYAGGSSGELTALAVRLTGATSDNAIMAGHKAGTAWSLIGLMRTVAFHAQAQRLFLPQDLMREFEIDRSALLDLKPSPNLNRVVRGVVARACSLLDEARALRVDVPRRSRAPLLLARLADQHLAEMARFDFDVFSLPPALPPRPLRLLWSHWQGRY